MYERDRQTDGRTDTAWRHRPRLSIARQKPNCTKLSLAAKDFFAARCSSIKSGLSRHAVSDRPSVTFVDHVKTNKHIFKIFSPSGSHTILVFPYQTAWRYSDENPLNDGVECRWGRQKSRFWAYIWLHCLLLTLQQARCCQHGRRWTTAAVRKLWNIAGSKRRCWLQEKTTKCLWKKPQRYAKDNRTTHLTARSDKSVAYVANNKRLGLYWTFCTLEANYWQTRSIAQSSKQLSK